MGSAWTRSEIIENIALWKKAYRAVIFSKSYTIGNRTLTRNDLDEINAELKRLQGQLDELEGKPTGFGHIRVGMSR